jgi:hypothetical protein
LKNGESGHPFLIPDFRGNSVFPHLAQYWYRFVICSLYYVKVFL